jgi:hypothetical protein
MIAHDAQTVELEPKFGLTFFEAKQKHLLANKFGQAEFPVIAPYRDVIAMIRFENTGFSRHR